MTLPQTLDQTAMNETLKAKHPDAYRDAFAAGNIAAFAGASIIVFPIGAVSVVSTLGSRIDFASAIVPAIIVALACSAIVNAIYFFRLRDEKYNREQLLRLAAEEFPEAEARFGDEGLVFSAYRYTATPGGLGYKTERGDAHRV